MNQTWVRYFLAAYITIWLAVGGWAINDRAVIEQRLNNLTMQSSEMRLTHERSISEVRLTSERAVSEVRLTSQTTNSQMLDVLRRLDRMESKLDALSR